MQAEHFINGGRTITVEQQVEKNCPTHRSKSPQNRCRRKEQRSTCIPTSQSTCEIYTQPGRRGLLFHTANGTRRTLYGNLADRWLTPRLVKMGLDEKGMGWHSFKRFRKTWLRRSRCLEDINNFWMAHAAADYVRTVLAPS